MSSHTSLADRKRVRSSLEVGTKGKIDGAYLLVRYRDFIIESRSNCSDVFWDGRELSNGRNAQESIEDNFGKDHSGKAQIVDE